MTYERIRLVVKFTSTFLCVLAYLAGSTVVKHYNLNPSNSFFAGALVGCTIWPLIIFCAERILGRSIVRAIQGRTR